MYRRSHLPCMGNAFATDSADKDRAQLAELSTFVKNFANQGDLSIDSGQQQTSDRVRQRDHELEYRGKSQGDHEEGRGRGFVVLVDLNQQRTAPPTCKAA